MTLYFPIPLGWESLPTALAVDFFEKMTIIEKTKHAAQKSQFTFYKEGVFYKCYNEDALVFVTNIRNYKVNSKFIKSVGDTVHSIGFPESEVRKGRLSLKYISEKIGASGFEVIDNSVVFVLDNVEVKGNYDKWVETLKEDMAVNVFKETEARYMKPNVLKNIANMINDFDLANSTPMQGLHFIQQLKSKLNNIENNNGNI